MALSDEDKKDLSSYFDAWLGQAADTVKKAIADGKATPPPPPPKDPPADPPADPPKDPPKDDGKLFTSKTWFGDRA